jgi:PAS domain S-box-containing protein
MWTIGTKIGKRSIAVVSTKQLSHVRRAVSTTGQVTAENTHMSKVTADTSQHGAEIDSQYVIDHVTSMLAYWDKDLRCRFANRAYESWFGVSPDQLIGTKLSDLLGPTVFALNTPYIQGVLAGKPQSFERELTTPAGVKRLSQATYIPDIVNGEVRGFFVEVADVTQLTQAKERLRAEVAAREKAYEALAATEAALQQAQQLGRIGSWEWDVEADVTRWSKQLYEIMGWDSASPPPTYAQHPQLYEHASWLRLQEAVSRCVQTGTPYQIDLQYVRPDGSKGWIDARGQAVLDNSGKVVRLHGTALEITARYRAEEEAKRLSLAEATTRNKTVFLSRLSHELRTPLNSVLGFAQLIQNRIDTPDRQKEWAAAVLLSGTHMLEMVEELLDLSGAELGEISVRSERVQVCPVVARCLEQAIPLAQSANVSLINQIPPDEDVHVAADSMRLKQVLNNIISNAIKYNRLSGKVTISSRIAGEQVEIEVQDTGLGLSPEQITKLFTPFERLGAENTAVPGAGVGMALTKELVRLMGGSVSVQSEPNVGTTFVVSLRRWPS